MHKRTMKVKRLIDISMTLLILVLMAYQVTGSVLHEWCGLAMILLFITHNALNFRWYRSLFQGRYSIARIVRTLINLCLLASMLCMAYSGIVLSRHVFAFLPIHTGMSLARRMHLAGSYWCFLFICLHLGAHWSMVSYRLFRKRSQIVLWIARLVLGSIVLYGLYCMYQVRVPSYLFLRVEFAFFDFGKPAVMVFIEHLAMMISWTAMGYYFLRILTRR